MCSNLALEDTSSRQLIALVRGALEELAGRAVPDSGAVAFEDARALGRALDIGEAALAVLVGRVDSSGVARQEGYPATVSWLRVDLGTAHGRAGERVTLARQLPRLERTRKLLSHGGLSVACAREICSAVVRLDDADAVVAEGILLGLVEAGGGARDVARAGTRISEVVRERRGLDSEPEDGRRDQRRSWLRRSRSHDGGSWVKGWLSPLDEATFSEIVDPLAKPAGKDDPRDAAEREADALMSVLAEGGRGAGVTVVADLAALSPEACPTPPATGPLGAEPATGPLGAEPATEGDGLSVSPLVGARLLNGTAVSLAQARRVALTAGINLLLMGKGGHPLYLGRRVRFASPAQRRVLEALYATCAVAGCEIPVHQCEIHHLGGGWKFGTPTNIDRLVPACRFHNAWIEDHADHVTETRDRAGRTQLVIQRQRRAGQPPDPRPSDTSRPDRSAPPSGERRSQGP